MRGRSTSSQDAVDGASERLMADADESIAPLVVWPAHPPRRRLEAALRVATRPPGTPGCAPSVVKAARRDLVGRGADRSASYAVPAPSQSFSTGASRQSGQLKLAAPARRKLMRRSAVGSTSLRRPRPSRTPARSATAKGGEPSGGRHTAPNHIEDGRRKLRRHRSFRSLPDPVTCLACAREGYTGRAGTASPP